MHNDRAFVVKTFPKEFDTPRLHYIFSALFHVYETVRHPVLVAPIGYAFLDADQTYRPSFLDPYIPSQPLTKFLDGTDQLSFEQKQVIILGVLHALLFLGSAVCSFHGNLNTDSILLDPGLQPHVISYGLTKIAKEVGVARAEPEFLSPEIYNGGTPSSEGDVFAFGILLKKLFSDSADSAPPRISQLVGDCVAENPENRPTLAVIAANVSWVGAVGDSVLAYIDSLTVSTPMEKYYQESEIALLEMEPPDDPQPSDPSGARRSCVAIVLR
jgi:serine/threonine protein kinase